jgi:hypothetical protein
MTRRGTNFRTREEGFETKKSTSFEQLSIPTSPSKVLKFDINGYFQSLKSTHSPKQELYFLKENVSARTKTTEDNSFKDTLSQRFTETTCFKELLNKDLGLHTLLKEARSSKKLI